MAPSQSERHGPGCREIPARQFYEDALKDCVPGGGMEAHIKRQMTKDIDGIVLMQCADGCPAMEAARERGRELAKEHGW